MAEIMENFESNKVNKQDGPILRSRQRKRSFQENRPIKRLFTPEIKRHLKSWLIRRRENPYPNREEKIKLAEQTGLTYIQICNWFANWRRKLKNSGKNVSKFTWSALIKSYNDRALGNVEHLSISSDDSIWEESDFDHSNLCDSKLTSPQIPPIDHCYSTPRGTSHKVSESKRSSLSITQTEQPIKTDYLPQCFQISSTTDFVTEPQRTQKSRRKINFSRKSSNSRTNEKTLKKHLDSKVKKSVRDKNWNYKRMMDELKASSGRILCSKEFQIEGDPLLLSKWKKSAARYQPSNRTYSNASSVRRKAKNFQRQYENFHGREELDAAEALTFLSRASTNKL